MHHFFLPPHLFTQPELAFPPETAHQIRAVLRLRAGQQVLALDNQGSAYRVELARVEAGAVIGRVLERGPASSEPACSISLYVGLTQREKFEWVLQKCTEVGASAFVPLISERSLVQGEREVEKKQARWQRILQEAAEQCGRGRIPVLRPAQKFEAALAAAAQENDLVLMPWEGETSRSLSAALAAAPYRLKPISPMRIGIFIGPEGGFSAGEVEKARAAGLLPVTLGSRILRMETAALVATALVLFVTGQME